MRIRLLLLLPGLLFVLLEFMGWTMPMSVQLGVFLAGLLMLGVPHGAADLLVADHVVRRDGGQFRIFTFLFAYLGRIVLFGLLLWLLPWVGLGLFLLISAFHFGETDLSRHELSGFWGKAFIVTYGMMLLGILLLTHLDEVQPLLAFLERGSDISVWMSMLERWRSITLVLFFTALSFTGLMVHRRHPSFFRSWFRTEAFLFPVMLLLLWRLPLLLGFTFYFIGWHSVISLSSIMRYLVSINGVAAGRVWKQMLLYSGLAIAGTMLIGASGFMFTEVNAMLWYAFMSLAVLTGPHMEVMHDMYGALRRK
ncbi:MAG: Brp/Blh family beta-carotene 15,15'-dioxygenase [Chitinophagaceae bacterium]|jgi:Brp/Blh family beta-carotene 15,15'-monooxygenase|nr:Brp/Blh family beta-carotene 15,15'-dioxygenase [Chitinophagaceae bacterium]